MPRSRVEFVVLLAHEINALFSANPRLWLLRPVALLEFWGGRPSNLGALDGFPLGNSLATSSPRSRGTGPHDQAPERTLIQLGPAPTRYAVGAGSPLHTGRRPVSSGDLTEPPDVSTPHS